MRVRYDQSLVGLLGNGFLLCTALTVNGRAVAAVQLPVPCVATSCGTGAKGFVTTGAATATQSGNSLSVNQTSNTATLNWSSFNIGAGGKVVFTQPSTTAIALNRIFDSNPSSIFGTLSSNGQIYLINANGFLFGSGATVNVGGLLASSLNLSDQNFAAGILAPIANSKPVLTPFVDASGNVVSQPITVQTGATLTAADGGRLLLAAPNVTNGGSLSAPDGQVILAAGQNVYLQASSDSNLRGLIVEVDSGGTVANQLAGNISAPRGNVTLTGLMVNQDGRVSATTSVAANGSVILQAADTITPISTGTQISASHGGTVELGPGSITEVLPEYSDTATAVTAQVQLQSSVSIVGQKVLMHDATIDAPGGVLTVLADSNPGSGVASGGVEPLSDPNAEIRIDSGTTIDLSGSDAELPMSANLVSVQLRSNQFADDPTQRGGALQSTPTNTVTVTVDMRADGGLGTPIADVTSAIAAVGQNIAQRTEKGGSASFESTGDVVFSSGASVNVSGGYTTYLGGSIQTTKLVGANGQLYDIGTANPLLTYTGVVNPTFTQSYDKWGIQDVIPTPGLSSYESTYVQGAAAGKVTIAAPSLYLDGTLQATAVTGALQRSAPPAGGTLIIGTPIATTSNQVDYVAPAVTFAATPTPIVVADGTSLPPQTLQVPTSYLTSDGFTSTTIYSNTAITLPAGLPLQLPVGAALTLEAPRIDVDSSISAVGGQFVFDNVLSSVVSASRAGIEIGDGVALNVSGQWTNDDIVGSGLGTAAIEQNAGSIAMHLTTPGSELVVGNNVSLSANGGAWLESSGTLAYGTGGSITLDASPALAALQLGAGVELQAFGAGTATGGTFNLSAPRIEVSAGQGGAWTEAQRVDDLTSTTGPVLNLYAPLFSNYGFSAVNLTATGAVESNATSDVLTVAAGTSINAQTSTLELNPNYQAQPTGTPLAGFTQVNLLPLYERPLENVSLNVERLADDQIQLLNANFGTLDVQAGASIVADAGATISLVGEGGVKVAGTLRAPGGKISIAIPAYEEVDPNDTTGQTDPGYVPSIGIDLAPTAVIDVSGSFIATPSSQGLATGTLLAGGAVSLAADRGFVTAEAGSTIDIRGTSATLDVPNAASVGGDTSEIVASAGGSLVVRAPESISLLGNLYAAAGKGNSGSAAAGSLEVDLEQIYPIVNAAAPAFPTGPLEIELVNSTAGAAPSPPSANIAVLGAQQIAASGIDSLTLRAGGVGGSIVLDNSQLSLGRELVLDAQTFTVPSSTLLSAPTVEFENSLVSGVVPTPFGGNGTLNVQAQQIVLSGNFALQGASKATFSSSGDVQLQGTLFAGATGPETGSIVASGSLAIDGLRVYPDTYTDFSISSVAGNGATVSIGSTGASPGTPLSADGAVAISADNILISGTLLAPFGSIELTANDSLKLATGSLVSVSGTGVDIPFGQTQLNQGEWIYDTGASGGTSGNIITSVPTKQVSLTAPSVTVQSGAVVNIQGGGDLYAYEWVPGTGGTNDNLNAVCCATATNTALSSIPNLYAILPASKGVAGPYDPQESTQTTLGQTIYLSGGAGIAAGYYALLPPRYALAPGAVLIQLESSFVSAQGGQIGTLANGTPVIGGYVTSGTTGLHLGSQVTDYEGVAIYPSGYAQKLSAYTISDASSYFSAIATSAGTGSVAEPADAGTFTISVTTAATNALDISGTVLAAAASGGRGAQINVSAPDLTITSGANSANDTTLAISGTVLQSWNASSLTLGGVASSVTETNTSNPCYGVTCTDIAVAANNVVIDSGVQLTADQIEIVAQQSITVQSGASLLSTSGKNGTPLSTLPSADTAILTTASAQPSLLPQAALLAVSDLSLPVVCRSTACLPSSGVAAPSTASTSAGGATISAASGSVLSSGGALSIDAPGDITLAGTLNGKGASWSLSSGSVAFVGSGTSTDTLNIGSGLLGSLQQAGAVRIGSVGSIDIDAPVSLGVNAGGTAPSLSSLTLAANTINDQGGSNASFGGTSVTLLGNIAPDPANPAAPGTAGTGNLSLIAGTLNLGPGVLQVNGFQQTTAQVGGAIETRGAGVFNVGGNLTLNAAELTAAPDAADEPGSTIAATGTLTLGAPVPVGAGVTLPKLVGGSLTLTAADIEDAGAIVASSGIVALNASGNLHLLSTASIDASGSTLSAVGQTAASPGGLVTLTSGGNVSLDAGSVVSVAGSATAPAGSLIVDGAGGTVALSGALNGAAAGNTGGSLTVNAGTLAGGLSSLVANAGLAGFSDAVNVRVHSGDLDLASGGSITSGSITLTADSGTVDIAGVLSAPSGAQRGLIDLSGGTGITLESTGQLHADGSGTAGRGGEIDLSSVTSTCAGTGACSSTGSITLDAGSVITASGAAEMGQLVLRAPALTATNDVAINQGSLGIGANVSQAGQVIIEPVMVAATSSGTVNTDLATAVGNASAFLSGGAGQTIAARLTATTTTPIQVQVGVELQDANAGDTLSVGGLDLSQYSTQGNVIDVALRAAGSINLNGVLSDGFLSTPGGRGTTVTSLTNQPSGSFTVVAGADLTSANSLSVLSASQASLTLAPAAIVRTGTGDIALAAAGDIVFQSNTTIGASVYTAGLSGVSAAVTVGSGKQAASFPTDGGDVTIAAGQDVVGAPFLNTSLDGGNFSVTGWQPHGLTTVTTATGTQQVGAYGVNFDAFDWNVGALGGGDVTVTAGGKVTNLSAATADSSPDGNTTLDGAGGGLRIAAVGDIASAQVYVADGVGTLTTSAGLTSGLTDSATGAAVGSSFALGNSPISVWARQSIQVDAAYNPTIVNAPLSGAVGQTNNFFTYGADSALNLTSTDGSVDFTVAKTDVLATLVGNKLLNASGGLGPAAFLDLPPTLTVRSLQLDVLLQNNGTLFPSSTGQLELFAGRDITGVAGPTLEMSDSAAVPTAASPAVALAAAGPQIGGLLPFQGVLHTGDTQPAIIAAGRDIDDVTLTIPKAAQISAGRDIIDLGYSGQNIAATDATVITAGRDITDTVTGGGLPIQVGGQGSLDIFAGRSINLGTSSGIVTVGNLENANLPSAEGADLTLAVGYGTQGADYSDFLKTIVAPAAATAYQTQLVNYVESQTGMTGLNFAQAEAIFTKFTTAQQTPLIDNVFFNELLLSGRAANSGSNVGFAEGYAAIDALYPGSRNATTANPNPYSGNLSLIASQIYTESGGNISILVPGGSIDVGLAFTPVGIAQKSAGQLGIVAVGAGNVDIYAEGDVNVNASRIFTLGGGNILIWSDEGSIDAGNGSKSSLAAPPPIISVTSSGAVQVDYGGSLSGSGIRTIQTNDTVAAGDVDLDAPVGTVDAGDAGIGAAGNINIAAAHVIGALNINFGGTAAGVPSDLSGLGASLSGVSAVAASATNSNTSGLADAAAQKETAPLAQTALSWLEVFVTGLGDENCKQDDIECLKRQKSAAP